MLPTLPELYMLPSVKLRLRLTPLFSMEPMDMLGLDTPTPAMLDILMLPMDLDMLDMLDILMLLDMLLTAHLPAHPSLVLPLPLLEDMPVLAVMSPTLLELSMLPSVKLKLRLTLLFSTELTDMLVLDMPTPDMLDILMLPMD